MHKENLLEIDGFKTADERVQQFKELFQREAPIVRKKLVQDLEAFNTLLDMEALSFHELALQNIAQNRGVEFDRGAPLTPECPHCGSVRIGIKEIKDTGTPIYRCYDCHKTFTSLFSTICAGSKKDLLAYVKLFYCMMRYESVEKTCEYIGCSPNTFYRMRSRIYYALEVFLEDLRLYGNVQVDETYTYISYKGGNRLEECQFPDDDDRYVQKYHPRAKRKRGGPYSALERNRNSICIFSAVDEFGHVMNRYSGVGIPSYRALQKHIPAKKFLDHVPNTDPFRFMKTQRSVPVSQIGDNSLIICDGSATLVKYVNETLSMKCYSRVFRRKGKQLKVPKKYKHLNLQRVNYVHRRLEEHLVRSGSGSSRYIKGSLLLFDFMMNTGAPRNIDAINELLHILVKPGLFRDEDWLERTFSVPNHLFEWFDQKNALSKLPYNKVFGFYLYDMYKHPEEYPETPIPTLSEIEFLVGLSITTIRSAYRDYSEAGYRPRIINHFDPSKKLKEKGSSRSRVNLDLIDEPTLALYDRWAEERIKPGPVRLTLETLIDEINSKYGSSLTVTMANRRFKTIEDYGIRPPLPDFNGGRLLANTYRVSPLALDILRDYNNLVDRYLSDGKPVPKQAYLCKILSERYPSLKPNSIKQYLYMARQYDGPEKQPGPNKAYKRGISVAFLEKIYEEYAEFRRANAYDSEKEMVFWEELFEKHRLSISVKTIKTYLRESLIRPGIKPTLPKYRDPGIDVGNQRVTERMVETLNLFESIVQRYKENGQKLPKRKFIYEEMQEQLNLSERTIILYLSYARKLRRKLEEDNGNSVLKDI